MTYGGLSKKERRRKAAAPLVGQTDLNMQRMESPRLRVKIPANVHTIFLGMGPGTDSAKRGHYFPGGSNYFWKLLHWSGIWPELLTSDQDDEILTGGFGLADVITRPTKGTVAPTKSEFMEAKNRIRNLIQKHSPRLLVFVGLRSYRTFLRRHSAQVTYGEQASFDGVRVFVVPSTSGQSMANMIYAEKLEWFKSLAKVVEEVRNPR